jgi:hypothetical protein
MTDAPQPDEPVLDLTSTDEPMDDDEPAHVPTESMGYAEFGAAFVRAAVTPDRICTVVRNLAGEAVRVGPLHAGPGGVAEASAVGRIGEPAVRETAPEPLAYEVTLPVDLELDVTVAGTKHHYDVDAQVRIRFRVVLALPLSICIEPESPTYRDVDVSVHPKTIRARVVGQAGNIDRELRKHIARYLRERIQSDVSDFAVVDLLSLIEDAAHMVTG